MPHLKDYILKYVKVYDNVVSKEFCDLLIDKFHKNRDQWISRDTNEYTFNEINLVKSNELFGDELQYLYSIFDSYVDLYKKDCGVQDFQFPQRYGFEEMRMKHYEAGKGEFRPHVDADGDAHKRFLVFFLYLDEGPGGATAFLDEKILCERKPGRMLMFPPSWVYPHAGMMPKEVDKHIIGSYLHYV